MPQADRFASIDKYAHCMREIKHRIEVIDHFVIKGNSLLYRQASIETACLQLRKTLELIAFASLSANKDAYSMAHSDFAKHYHAERLLRDLERINQNFYPFPFIEVPCDLPEIRIEHKPRQDDFLTREEFVKAYEKCGGMLHARNPFGGGTPYEYFEQAIPKWRNEIVNLLNCHSVHPHNDPSIWVIHMKENGDDEVHYYEFEQVARK